jgi:hypothetical protein
MLVCIRGILQGGTDEMTRRTKTLKELIYIRKWGKKFGWDATEGLVNARITALKRERK